MQINSSGTPACADLPQISVSADNILSAVWNHRRSRVAAVSLQYRYQPWVSVPIPRLSKMNADTTPLPVIYVYMLSNSITFNGLGKYSASVSGSTGIQVLVLYLLCKKVVSVHP